MKKCKTPGCDNTINDDVMRVLCDVCLRNETIKDLHTEIKHLQNLIDELEEGLFWCSGSEDFQTGGKARRGWLKLQHELETLRAKIIK